MRVLVYRGNSKHNKEAAFYSFLLRKLPVWGFNCITGPFEQAPDLVIVQNRTDQQVATRRFEKTPVIFISHSAMIDHIPSIGDTLIWVVSTTNNFHLRSLGIPDELVSCFYFPYEFEKNDNGRTAETAILFISNDDNRNDISIEMKVLQLFNRQPFLTYISTTREKQRILKEVANSTVRFANKRLYESIKAGIVIASGFDAQKHLGMGDNVFVLGSRGIGGLVTQENVRDFIRTDFQGRIGGQPGESMPIDHLDHQLETARKKLKDEVVNTSGFFTNRFDINRFIGKIYDLFRTPGGLSRIDDHSLPELNRSIYRILPINKDRYFLMNNVNSIVFEISSKEYSVINNSDGKKTVKELAELSAYSMDDLQDFFLPLMQKGIVRLKQLQNINATIK
jgi:hypothetical protein